MIQQTQRLAILSRLKTVVLKHHFNIGNVDYAEWCREVDEQSAALITTDNNAFEEGVRGLLTKLKSSHTAFYATDVNTTKPEHIIGATLRSLAGSTSRWMFLDVYDEGPAARAGAAPGQILTSVDGKPVAPPALPLFRFGHEHRVTTRLPGDAATRDIVITVPQRKTHNGRPPLIEPKCMNYRMLTKRVGLLKVPFFSGSFGFHFSKLLRSAVEDLKGQGCDKLIVDLRGCLGGSLGFASLVSYFCADRIPIGYDVTPKRLRRGYDVTALPRVSMPKTRLGLLLCLSRFLTQDKSLMLLTQGLGRQPFHGRVVLLVNEHTNSAGEMVAQFAKNTKLATLVGQKTKGNVLGSTTFTLGSGYNLYMPVFGWYSPDGSYTEGSGVEPDVPIDIDPDRLARGIDAQMDKALDVLHASE